MGGTGGAEGKEETDQAAAPSTGKAEGIGRDEQGSAGRRLENRASSSRRRAGAGGRAGRRGETGEARAGQRGERHAYSKGKGRDRQGRV